MPPAPSGTRITLALCGILVVFLLLSLATARTAAVLSTEAWFADPAYNLLHHGCLCTTIIESKGFWLAGVDRHTYWILPLHALLQTVWYRVFGFSLWSLRGMSMAAGVLLLVAWFLIIRRLAGARTALLALLLIAVDWRVVQASARGRMDMLCAALGAAALAVYLTLRERHLMGAILAGNTLLAASCLTHPCGILWIPCMAAMLWQEEPARARWRLFTIAAVPCVIAAGLYGMYISEAPQDFVRQIQGNTSGFAGELGGGRFRGLASPLSGLVNEWRARYVPAFEGPWRLQYLILFLYAAGVTLLPRARRLWILTASPALLLWLLDGTRLPFYLVHVVPAAAACTAVWLGDRFEHAPRRFWAAGIAGLVGLQLVATGAGVRQNAYAHEHQPVVEFLRSHARPGDIVMGPAGLAFGVGFDGGLVDDVRLGYFSGKQPRFFATNSFDRRWIEQRRFDDPPLYRHITHSLATNYREVFRNSGCIIHARRDSGSGTAAGSGDGNLTKGVASK